MGNIGFLSDDNKVVLVLLVVLDIEQNGMVRFTSVDEIAEMDDIVTFAVNKIRILEFDGSSSFMY